MAKNRPGRWRARADTYGTHAPNQPEGLELQFKPWWLSTIPILLSLRAMQIDTDDLVSASTLTRNTAFYVREAAAGRRIIILNNSLPTAALVSFTDLRSMVEQCETHSPTATGVETLLRSLGIKDLTSWSPRTTWAATASPDIPLVAPIGTTSTGVHWLNLSDEAATAVSGAGGTGKSSLIRNLVLGLCARYSPTRLRILLTDAYPHPAISALPHVTTITSPDHLGLPADSPTAGQRFVAAATAELRRRQNAPTLDGEPDFLVVLDNSPQELAIRDELRDVIAELVTNGQALRIYVLFAASNVTLGTASPRAEIFGGKVALRQTDERDTAELIGETPNPPLANWDAIVQLSTSADLTRVTLFNPDTDAYTVVHSEDDAKTWRDLLVDRIRAVAAESSAD